MDLFPAELEHRFALDRKAGVVLKLLPLGVGTDRRTGCARRSGSGMAPEARAAVLHSQVPRPASLSPRASVGLTV